MLVLLQNYFSICVPKIIKIQCSWTKLLQKNKRVHCPTVFNNPVFEIFSVKRQKAVSERPKMIHSSPFLDPTFGDDPKDIATKKRRRPVPIIALPSRQS